MARKFGEPPGQTRTKRRKKKNAYSKFGLAPAFVGNVAKGIGEDLVSMGKTAFDPRLPFMREKNAEKVKRDAALLGMTVIPGGKVVKPIANAVKGTKKTAKTTGTSTVKKTTKKAAAKKTTKKTTAKKTKPDLGYPGGLSPKQTALKASIRKKYKENAAKRNKGDGKAPPVTRKPADSELLTPQEMADKAATGRLKDIQRLRKDKSPKPKKNKIKSDGPGEKRVTTKPKRKNKYKPTPTTTRNTQRPDPDARTGTPTEAQRNEILNRASGGKWKDGKEPFGPREKGDRAGYKGKEKAHQRANERDKQKREAEKGSGKTPIQREKTELDKARRDKAGGTSKVENAINDTKLGGNPTISQMSPKQLKRALANPRSSESRLMKQLEKRAKRGNLREGEMQVLSRLRANSPKNASASEAENLMQYTIRPSGQPDRVAGTINPPAIPKASNQKWRGEGGKGAPKGPTGGGAKRGEKITERTGAEDGVTRKKGTGGQKRRVIKPSTDVAVSRGGPRGQRVGGGSSSGRKPIALGSGRKAPSKDVVKGEVVRGGRNNSGSSSGGTKGRTRREPIDLKTRPRGSRANAGAKAGSGPRAIGGRKGKEVAVRGAGTVATNTRNQAAAAGSKKSKKGALLALGSGAAALGGAAAMVSQLGEKAKETAPAAEKDTTAAPATKLKDKYGRRISREEFNKREAYRKRLSKMTPDQAKRARKKEMKRREQYRKSEGKREFGKEAKGITRNKELAEGVSSRYVNAKLKRAKTEAERKAIRKKYKRKNKK